MKHVLIAASLLLAAPWAAAQAAWPARPADWTAPLPPARSPVKRHLIDADTRGLGGFLVHVACGSEVDEAALMAFLQSGGVGASGLGLVRPEFQVPEALRASNDVMPAPHVASATVQTRQAMAQRVLDNLDAFFAGRPLPSQAEA